MKLLIVESPAKARTLKGYLKGFDVEASMGHVKDLPRKTMGVDIDNGFEPEYVIIPGKKKTINQLKSKAKKAEVVYIGADPDREGEAIAQHIASELKGVDVRRVLFNEITKRGVLEALENDTEINEQLYNSQQARRILDRLVGYKLSPFLWKAVKKGLSAGRVQSVALKIVVDREKKIRAFKAEEYWRISAEFSDNKEKMDAELTKVEGKKAKIENEKQATSIKKEIEEISADDMTGFSVTDVKKRKTRENPKPPFNTSLLQQAGAGRFSYNTRKIMRIAQSLYEGKKIGSRGVTGLITYMRTDSFRVSEDALKNARSFISKKYGKPYLPGKPKFYRNKKGKTQDAHEAIRPTDVELTPETVKPYLSREEFNIYNLIWRRFVSSQMTSAVFDKTSLHISDAGGKYLFVRSGKTLDFDGFLRVYASKTKDDLIPRFEKDTKMSVISVNPTQHFTKPPARYTEGTLVKALEEKGIGRPSTYAAIINQIISRKYIVYVEKRKLAATELGEVVNQVLQKYFRNIINVKFTAEMEEKLDNIAEGDINWKKVLESFYEGFDDRIDKSLADVKKEGKVKIYAEDKCPECGEKLIIRWSRENEAFLSCDAFPECRFTAPVEKRDDGKYYIDKNAVKKDKKTGEKCPECGSELIIKNGRYGEFTACSAFPKCRYIKREEKVICDCPEKDCDGKVVELKTRRRKLFYGCNRYPKCKFKSWSKPVEGEKCEKCGAEYIVENKHSGKHCAVCGEKVK
ncbi:MAG: type I DNA topoisomerase [bacterium]